MITQDTKQPIMEVKDLIREFPAGDEKIRVLHGIDLTIYEGEMVAIIGQSGSGKSTLMNILGCLDQATAGSYHIYGKAVDKLTADELAELRREHFGFIFQRYHLLGDINAQDNVAVPAVYAGMPVRQREARATQLLDDLGLGAKTQNRPSQLSGGQQQRVSIARALMNGGDIILADEPTGALDSQSGKDVMAILRNLNSQGHTIIMVTHDPSIAAQAERVIEIKDGQILKDYYTDNRFDKTTEVQHLNFAKKSGVTAFLDRLSEAFKMSVLAMKAHKMRTLLTMLGIIIGIASVVSVVGLGQGSQQKILNDISSLGTNTLTIRDGYKFGDPRRKYHDDNLTDADANAVAEQPYVQSVSPQVSSNSASARYRETEASVNVSGVGKDYLTVKGEKLALGQTFNDNSITSMTQDVIIDNNAKTAFFANVSDPIGEVMLVGSVPARVIGVLQPSEQAFGPSSDTPTLYMPYTTVMHRMVGTSHVDSFIVLLKNTISSSAAEQAVSDLIEQRHGTDDFRIQNSDSIRQTIESTTGTMTLLVSSIAIISLIVGGIGVMNIMLVSVTERTSEIGVRMAVGARQSDIMQQFLIEAILVCILGGILGISLAFAIGALINKFAGGNFQVVYSTTSIVAAVVCSTLIGVVFGFIPARNAARLNPVDALSGGE
ncbi:MAG: MacB family efflux pump subunit [Moraxella sp.]|jgi:macrolide transport system ATP-binding/permease protein|uniref:Pyoverdine export ATP-binding/permease protein PvdT n=1 Tax=Faucicola osloensis TaxID=34062 RepID=A0A6P1KIN7_FAUOS|nr:MacB family efflux pump subunit [Moraxella osloensis]MBP6341182.1 MacB family efflux pump subunit [Moraxella sp.]MBP7233913.1 MacB family efflux pump subunit [Moraxella sp.]QHG09787.1 MacB family efflux pump subunit [Moraxella osloensis]